MNEQHRLPAPSVWPATVGMGVMLMAFGIATNLYFSLAGAVFLAIGLVGWIQDLRHG
jgi:hypothetical protein